jgi:hypothetical protein
MLLTGFGERLAPIDLTEFGALAGDAQEEQQRAQLMSVVGSELARSNCGVGVLAPYDWINPDGEGGGDWGLADFHALRPAGSSWFAGVRLGARSSPTNVCP